MRARAGRVVAVAISAVGVAACAAVADRPARSSIGCAQAAIDRHLPRDLPDKLAHCVAGGVIARYCSPAEARLAGVAKELEDAFGDGDMEWSDWQATRAGVRCAGTHADVESIIDCCRTGGVGVTEAR